MPDFDALKKLLIVRLYDQACAPNAPNEISGIDIAGLLKEETGTGYATQVYSDLLNQGLLRQTTAAHDEEGGYFEVTVDLLRLAEQIRHSEPSSR